MTNVRWFHLSCDTFGGFKCIVDLDEMDCLEDIVKYVINSLNNMLILGNFEHLINKAKNMNFHIHDVDFGEIIMSEPNTIFYVCNHCS